MNFPRVCIRNKLLCALVLLLSCALAGARDGHDKDRKHPVPPNQQHGDAQAGLGIQLTVAPVVLPPRDKDRDHDHASVLYNLMPSPERISVTKETRSMTMEGSQVQLITVVVE